MITTTSKIFQTSFTKFFAFSFILFAAYFTANAQVKIGDNPSNINTNAILDLESSEKGLLLPRMNSTQRAAIQNPTPGLVVYDISSNQFMYYNGTAWVSGVPYSGGTADLDLGNNSISALSGNISTISANSINSTQISTSSFSTGSLSISGTPQSTNNATKALVRDSNGSIKEQYVNKKQIFTLGATTNVLTANASSVYTNNNLGTFMSRSGDIGISYSNNSFTGFTSGKKYLITLTVHVDFVSGGAERIHLTLQSTTVGGPVTRLSYGQGVTGFLNVPNAGSSGGSFSAQGLFDPSIYNSTTLYPYLIIANSTSSNITNKIFDNTTIVFEEVE